MAEGGERRMLFDTRGKRKNVIRVVYAVLALLMGTSLFFVVGPVNIGELVGNSATGNASEAADEQVERIEARVAKNPDNEELLLILTRAQIAAGNARIEPTVSETEVAPVSAEAREKFEAASLTWNRYLKAAGDEPNANAAQLVAATFFRLAESSTSFRETELSVARATEAQRIATEARPSLGSLSTLAIYEYYNGEFAAGDKTAKQVVALTPSKAEAVSAEKQLDEYRKRAKQFDKRKQRLEKVQQEVGKEQLQNPLRTLGPPGSLPSE